MVYIILLIPKDSNIYQIYSLNSNFCLGAVCNLPGLCKGYF